MKTGSRVMMVMLLAVGTALAVVALRLPGTPAAPEVIVYVSVDRVHAEPLLDDFAAQTGIRVRPVYDVEAAKTTGLVQKLIAEKEHPQADLFFNGEFMQTLTLKDRDVLATYRPNGADRLPAEAIDPEGRWTGVGGRARVFLVHREHVPEASRPKRLEDLVTTSIPGERIGMAWPFFGTSATHAAALYAAWGPRRTQKFFADLKAHGVRFVDGNSVVRDLVVQGELWVGLTDSDDALGALERQAPVKMILPDQEENGLGTLRIPATIALIAGAQNPQQGRALADFLIGEKTEQKMIASGFCQYPLRGDARTLRTMRVRIEDIAKAWPVAQRELREILVR